MSDAELKSLWQSQKLEPAKFSPADQVKLVRKKAKWRNFVFLWCDVWLVGVEVALILAFAWTFLKTPAPVARVGLVIIIAAGTFIIWKTLRARRVSAPPSPDAPVTEWLRHELEKVRAQYQLARTSVWWYVLPPWVGMNVYCWGLGGDLVSRIGCSVVFTLIGAVYWVLNRWTLQKHWPPLIAELESLLKSDTFE